MYKWILKKKGILNKREYLGPVWPADVWPADDIPFLFNIHLFSMFTYTWFGTKTPCSKLKCIVRRMSRTDQLTVCPKIRVLNFLYQTLLFYKHRWQAINWPSGDLNVTCVYVLFLSQWHQNLIGFTLFRQKRLTLNFLP